MKNSPGKWISVVFAFCVLHFFGGNMYAKSSVPYQIKGELKLNSAAEGSGCNFEGLFSNLADKAVNSFTIVFYVFDKDGNCPLKNRNNAVIKIEQEISEKKDYEFAVNMDKFLRAPVDTMQSDEIEYETEYLYVSAITYCDGSEWTDPFGFEVF